MSYSKVRLIELSKCTAHSIKKGVCMIICLKG